MKTLMLKLFMFSLAISILTSCQKKLISNDELFANKFNCFENFSISINNQIVDFNSIGLIHNDIIDGFSTNYEITYNNCNEILSFRNDLNSVILGVVSNDNYIDTSYFNDCSFLLNFATLYDRDSVNLIDSLNLIFNNTHHKLLEDNFATEAEVQFLEDFIYDFLLNTHNTDFCDWKGRWDNIDKESSGYGIFSGTVLSIAKYSSEYWSNLGYNKTNWFTLLAASDVAGAYLGGLYYLVNDYETANGKELGKACLYGAASGSLLRRFMP